MTTMSDRPLSRRAYLTISAVLESGVDYFTAAEAVASTALAHPEVDMTETRTWSEWEAEQ